MAPGTVSNYISELCEAGYLERKIEKNEKKQIMKRKLYPRINQTIDGGFNQTIDRGGSPNQDSQGVKGRKNDASVEYSSVETIQTEPSSIMQSLSSNDPSNLNANDLIKLFNHYMQTIADFERTTTNWGKEGKIMKRLAEDYMDGSEMAVDYLKWIARNKADAFEHTKNSWNNAGMLNKFIDEYKNWRKAKEKDEQLAEQIDAGAPDVDKSVDSMDEAREIMG